MERALLVLSAWLLNVFFGGPRRVYVALGLTRIARLPMLGIRDIERKLNREHRSLEALVMRGWVCAWFAVFACIVFGLLLGWILHDNLQLLEILLLAVMLPFRSTRDSVAALRKGLRENNLQ